MHSYEKDEGNRAIVAILGISVLLVWLLHEGMDAIQFDPQWWISVPSFAGCYSILYWLFDRHIWNCGLFRKIGLVRLPDLSGKWVGEAKSSYSEYGQAYPVTVVITQRWSKIAITLETERSRSDSTMARVKSVDSPNRELSYLYVNEPKLGAPSSMEMHRGTATLTLTDSALKGNYYTGRGRREMGTLVLRRT